MNLGSKMSECFVKLPFLPKQFSIIRTSGVFLQTFAQSLSPSSHFSFKALPVSISKAQLPACLFLVDFTVPVLTGSL